jgi:hypothetical protein
MWLALSLFGSRAREADTPPGSILARGLVAAIAAGLAFQSISHIWTDPTASVSYPLRFLYWTWAFLPGFAALLLRFADPPRRDV